MNRHANIIFLIESRQSKLRNIFTVFFCDLSRIQEKDIQK